MGCSLLMLADWLKFLSVLSKAMHTGPPAFSFKTLCCAGRSHPLAGQLLSPRMMPVRVVLHAGTRQGGPHWSWHHALGFLQQLLQLAAPVMTTVGSWGGPI